MNQLSEYQDLDEEQSTLLVSAILADNSVLPGFLSQMSIETVRVLIMSRRDAHEAIFAEYQSRMSDPETQFLFDALGLSAEAWPGAHEVGSAVRDNPNMLTPLLASLEQFRDYVRESLVEEPQLWLVGNVASQGLDSCLKAWENCDEPLLKEHFDYEECVTISSHEALALILEDRLSGYGYGFLQDELFCNCASEYLSEMCSDCGLLVKG